MQAEKTALIIDDNDYFSSALETLLEYDGFKVQICSNAADGLVLAKERSFDIFIIDFRLPDMNGNGIAAFIRRIRPTAVIVGCSTEPKEQQFLSSGADTFILKAELPGELPAFMRRHRLQSGQK